MSQVWEKWQDEINGMMSKFEAFIDLGDKTSPEEPKTMIAETGSLLENVNWIDFGVTLIVVV